MTRDWRETGVGLYLFALLALLTCVAYFPVVRSGLAYEDARTIYDASVWAANGGWSMASLLKPAGRDLTAWTFSLQAGQGPWAYHVVNLLIHLANGLLLSMVLTRMGVRIEWALAALGVFWLHPLQVEAVAYVSGRFDLLATTGILIALSALGEDWWWPGPWFETWLVAGVGLWIALHAKESVAGAAVGVFAVTALNYRSWPQRRVITALGVLGMAGIVLVAAYGAHWPETEALRQGMPTWKYLLLQTVAVCRMVTLTVLPVPAWMTVDVDLQDAPAIIWSVLALVVVEVVVIQACYSKAWRLAATWVVCLVAVRFVVRTEWLSEHQWYPVLTGLVVIAAKALDQRRRVKRPFAVEAEYLERLAEARQSIEERYGIVQQGL